MNFSSSEENYLKTIYLLQEKGGKTTTNALAEKLNAKPASITDMMKKLSRKRLVHYKPYYGFSLTAEGRRVALHIIRRHRLWEFFLAEKLQFGWQDVHSLAEELEHISNKELVNKLDAYLGFPRFDPHGDPIPDEKGKMAPQDHISLTHLEFNRQSVVSYVSEQSRHLLEALDERKISIGCTIEVKRRFAFDGSLQVKVKNKSTIITDQLAKHVFVKPNQDGTN